MKIPLEEIRWPEERLRSVGDYSGLAASIRDRGQLQPAILADLGDAESPRYEIVAGFHRFLSAYENGAGRLEAEVRVYDDPLDQELDEIAENLHRKELTALERAEHVRRENEIYEARGQKAKRGQRVTRSEKFSHLKTEAEIAGRMNMGVRAMRIDEQIARGIPKPIRDAIRRTSIAGNQRELRRLARLPVFEQMQALYVLLHREAGGDPVSGVFDCQRRARRILTGALVGGADAEAAKIPENHFRTIVCDPPWSGSDTGDVDGVNGKVGPAYPTMSAEEIAALPVGDYAREDDCHLYLWVTSRVLLAGLHKPILEAWGFRAITTLVWAKEGRPGTGRYFRNQHEMAVFAVKGTRELARADASTVFGGARGRHSEKPQEFYELVESCSPGPRLAMFERRQREGWTAHGTLEHAAVS